MKDLLNGGEHLVCILRKTLYGLKEVSELWFDKIDLFLLEHSYKRRKNNPNLYTIVLVMANYVGN